MGYCLEIVCKACGYKENFRLGQGMNDCRPNWWLKHFTDKALEEAKQVVEKTKNRDGILMNFEYKLGQCTECGKLLKVPTLHVTETGFDDYEVIGQCDCKGKCNQCTDRSADDDIKILLDQTNVDELDSVRIRCPQCKDIVQLSVTDYWD